MVLGTRPHQTISSYPIHSNARKEKTHHCPQWNKILPTQFKVKTWSYSCHLFDDVVESVSPFIQKIQKLTNLMMIKLPKHWRMYYTFFLTNYPAHSQTLTHCHDVYGYSITGIKIYELKHIDATLENAQKQKMCDIMKRSNDNYQYFLSLFK